MVANPVILEWGHEFRPEYRKLSSLRLGFPEVPIMALTATATSQVEKDIFQSLLLRQPVVFRSSLDRTNLYYACTPKKGAYEDMRDIFTHLSEYKLPMIIYCVTIKEAEAVYITVKGLTDLKVGIYHGSLEPDQRYRTHSEFIRDNIPILVATEGTLTL